MNFVFMLTHNDSTVPGAAKVYESLRGTALHYVGFKDIGATPGELAVVADKAHADGLEVMLEVVSTSRESEIVSLEAGRDIGVDWILGGTHADDGVRILAGSGIKYCPFPGRIDGHPSVLSAASPRSPRTPATFRRSTASTASTCSRIAAPGRTPSRSRATSWSPHRGRSSWPARSPPPNRSGSSPERGRGGSRSVVRSSRGFCRALPTWPPRSALFWT